MRTFAATARKLADLNRRLAGLSGVEGVEWARVVAFTVYPDEEGDDVADVLLVLSDPSDGTWPIEAQDVLCTLAGDALDDTGVKFTYCTFRTESEHAEVGIDGWEPVPPDGG